MTKVPDHMASLEILQAACCVAAQDGRVSAEERALLDRLAETAGVGDVSLAAMIEAAEGDRDFSRSQFTIVQTDPLPTIRALAAVALADGDASERQVQVLASFAKRLGVDEARLRSILEP